MGKIRLRDYIVQRTSSSVIKLGENRNVWPLFGSIDGKFYRENYTSNGSGSFLTYQHISPSTTSDLNDLVCSGMYMLQSTPPANMPADVHVSQGAGVLVLSWNQDTRYQIFFSQETQRMYFRAKTTTGWQSWKSLAFLSDIPKG